MLVYMSLCVFSVCLCIYPLRYVSVSLCVRFSFCMCACFHLNVRAPVYICVHVYNVCGCACTHVSACIWMLGPYSVFLYCSSPYIFSGRVSMNLELTSSASLADQHEPGSPLFIHLFCWDYRCMPHTQLSHGCSELRSSCVLRKHFSPEAVFLVEMLLFVCGEEVLRICEIGSIW